MERCLACEADAVGTMEGSRFYPDPYARTFLKTPVYQMGVCEQAALANVS
jgi:hypothetical protein